MAAIEVAPICDISITEKDLFNYYTENNIKNYPKKINGMPKMKSKFNKTQAQILYNKKALLIDEQYEQAIKDTTKEKHSEVLKKKMEECKMCVICGDDMKSISMLECGHTMCVKCTISHFRVNNVCPFCRAPVCDKPSVRLVMQNQTTMALIEQNLASLEADRFNLTMTEYIRNRLAYYKTGGGIELDGLTHSIVREIHSSMVDLSASINTWYA
jgi:hypothetical protein